MHSRTHPNNTHGSSRRAAYLPCWNVTVIAAQGCPSGVLINMNVEDSKGNVVDSASDQVFAAVAPGQRVLLKPVYTGTGAAGSGTVTNIACE